MTVWRTALITWKSCQRLCCDYGSIPWLLEKLPKLYKAAPDLRTSSGIWRCCVSKGSWGFLQTPWAQLLALPWAQERGRRKESSPKVRAWWAAGALPSLRPPAVGGDPKGDAPSSPSHPGFLVLLLLFAKQMVWISFLFFFSFKKTREKFYCL